jgi:membrane protease YdiL (CAAX protease family)
MYFVTSVKKIVPSKYYFIFDLLLVVYISTSKQFFSHQHYEIRMLLYLLFPFYIILVALLSRFNKGKLGLSVAKVNWFPAFKQSFLPTLICIGLLTLFRSMLPALFNLGIHYNSIIPVIYRGLAYIVISVPAQELIFRGYVISRLEQYSHNKYFLIFISALLFSAIHWPFKSLLISLGSFLIGIYLADSFIKYRNLYLSMWIHSVLGIVVMLFTVKLG